MGSTSSDPSSVDPDAVAEVVDRYPVKLAVLFGSHASGDVTSQSDVDVAVSFEDDPDAADRLQLRIDLTVDLIESLGTDDIDVTDLDVTKPSVATSALESGIVLVGDRETVETARNRFDRGREDETHEDRMRRFDSILERLEAEV